MFAMPPAIIREFLGQFGEMLDRLDRDLEQLRRAAGDARATDRISGALSAIGTGAGFLHLTDLEHATADAAAALRNLQGKSVENNGRALTDLAAAIEAMRACRNQLSTELNPDAPVIDRPAAPTPAAVPGVERRALRLDDSKTPLVEFMVEDLRDAIALAEQAADRMDSPAGRSAGASELHRIGVEMARTARFFELDGMHKLAVSLESVGTAVPNLMDAALSQLFPRVRAVLELLRELADGLAYSAIIVRPIGGICDAIRTLCSGQELPASSTLPEGCTSLVVLERDGVVAPSDQASEAVAPVAASEFEVSPVVDALPDPMIQSAEPIIDDAAASDAARIEAATAAPAPSATPEPQRLDAAMAELANLIAQSNRLAAIPGEASPTRESPRLVTRIAHISDDVARATGDMKAAVLNARALPLSGLFDACLDAAVDAAGKRGFTLTPAISGGAIEADMGVIDRLREPMSRVAADLAHACRISSKPAEFTLSAAVDEATSNLDLRMVLDLEPGASATGGSALAALRSTVEAIRGAMFVQSDESGRTEVSLRVPANLAFVYCTVIRIGGTLAAIPMSGVDEVIKPEPDQIVDGQSSRALLVREGAAELLDGHALFGDGTEPKGLLPYAVVVSHDGKRVALACSRALGAQEVVVRPMDPLPRRLGPISGVGASSSGMAALIIDVPALVRMAGERTGRLGIAA
jgi:chemotaxis protein histidine kinase CheA